MTKFLFYNQQDSMQCGVACLQMVSNYFGREYSLYFLSDICFAIAISWYGLDKFFITFI
ncbi:MAG: hypothetical protein KBG68_05935 [Prevotella sp.]|nr:hypothetical protein [Prevotella sp.]